MKRTHRAQSASLLGGSAVLVAAERSVAAMARAEDGASRGLSQPVAHRMQSSIAAVDAASDGNFPSTPFGSLPCAFRRLVFLSAGVLACIIRTFWHGKRRPLAPTDGARAPIRAGSVSPMSIVVTLVAMLLVALMRTARTPRVASLHRHSRGAGIVLAAAAVAACAGSPASASAPCPADSAVSRGTVSKVPAPAPTPASSDYFHEPGVQVFTVVRHPPLDLGTTPSPEPFLAAGCAPVSTAELDCNDAKAIATLGCSRNRVWLAPELDVFAPGLAYCSVPGSSKNAGMPPSGCMSMHRRVVVAVDPEGTLTLLERRADVIARAVPIDSREKALAVVMATSGAAPSGDESILRYGHVHAAKVESTFVDWMEGGFRVHAFVHDICSCGPHPTNAVDTFVSWSGEMKELSKELAYDDGSTSCAD